MSEKPMPDIDRIIANLGEQDIEALKKAAQSIFGDEGAPAASAASAAQAAASTPDFSSILNNAELLEKISTIMSAMNKTDSRTNLIAALKPLLSEPRRKKADEAMQLLRLMEIMPMLFGKEQ